MKNSNSYQNKNAKGFIFCVMLITALILSITSAFSQEKENWKLNSLTFGAGETPFGGNVNISAKIKREKQSFSFIYKDHLWCVIGDYSPQKNFSLGMSAGSSDGKDGEIPWFGPIINTNFFNGHLTTMHWVGGIFGEEKTEAEYKFYFSYQKVKISHNLFFSDYDWFSVYYALKHYREIDIKNVLTDATHVMCMNQSWEINNNIAIGFEEGYMFPNGNFEGGKWLWSGTFTYSFR